MAQRFLAARPRSESEVRRRLARAGCDATTLDAAVDRLRHAGLLDDVAFASYWLGQRQTFKPRGARLLRAELRQHGVSAELASDTTDAIDSAEEDAYRAAYKRATQLAHLDAQTFKNKLGQHLARRGFDWDVIGPTVDRLRRELPQLSS
ncbi:MAG TPA: regulatory protein RecX [Chloroflexota bacterium]